jgi:hypothetical protein
MATTDFSTGTVIESAWLNDVDEAVYTTLPTKAPIASPTFTGTVGGITSTMIGNTPAGNIAATTVQAAINELDNEKAALAGSASQSFAMLNGTVAGTLSLTGTASTLGYGTGAGGTVTQATSKSTTVTLNKPCGQITMNNEALAAGAAIAFDLTNSLITSGDVVVVNSQNFGHYSTTVQTLLSGGARIRLTNLTAGTLSDAVVINFAIIKGATS